MERSGARAVGGIGLALAGAGARAPGHEVGATGVARVEVGGGDPKSGGQGELVWRWLNELHDAVDDLGLSNVGGVRCLRGIARAPWSLLRTWALNVASTSAVSAGLALVDSVRRRLSRVRPLPLAAERRRPAMVSL